MRTDYHVHFYIRKTKINKIGLAPIYLRLVVKKRRAEYSISRSVDPKLWNTKIEKVMGNNREAQEINNHIANLRHKLNRIHQTSVDNDIEISAQSLMYNSRGVSCPRIALHLKAILGQDILSLYLLFMN